jgi:hypothetical protein
MLLLLGVLLVGCAAPSHQSPSFDEVDVDGDGIVTWPEHERAFPKAGKNAFFATDENLDRTLDRGEFDAGFGLRF